MRQIRYKAAPKDIVFVERKMIGDDFLRTVFAPDPKTGWPASDYQVLVSSTTLPEVKDYILSKLQSIQVPLPKGEASEVMVTMKNYGETTEQYLERLRNYSSAALHSVDDDYE